jgi:hypothetical protein
VHFFPRRSPAVKLRTFGSPPRHGSLASATPCPPALLTVTVVVRPPCGKMTLCQSASKIVKAVYRERSRNLLAMYAYFVFAIASSSLLDTAIFNSFVSKLPGFDTNVTGQIRFAGGFVAAACAVPLGILADRWSKVKILRIAAVVTALYAVLQAAAIIFRLPFLFYAASVLSQVKMALIAGPQIALIILSTSPPNRLLILIFVTGIIEPIAITAGPLSSMIADAVVGTGGNMSEDTEAIIMVGACVVNLIAAPFLAMATDKGYYKEPPSTTSLARRPSSTRASFVSISSTSDGREGNSDSNNTEGTAAPPLSLGNLLLDKKGPQDEVGKMRDTINSFELKGNATIIAKGREEVAEEPSAAKFNQDAEGTEKLLPEAEQTAVQRQSQRLLYAPVRLFGCIPLIPQSIPYLIFANDFSEGFASGLTDSFFVSMMTDYYHLTTMQALGVVLASGFTTAFLSVACMIASYPLGRALSIAVADFTTLLCMAVFALEPPLWLAITSYILISGLQSGTIGVQRGMLPDIVSPSSLSFWNSLENVS